MSFDMEDYLLSHFYPMLPSVRLAVSVDFGYGDRCDWPNAIHFRLINRARNNGESSGLQETASYICQNDPETIKWSSDMDGFDNTLQVGEAYDLYKRMGYGYVVTGSVKEKRFLEERGIKSVAFVDEGHLEGHLKHLYHSKGLYYQTKELPRDFDLSNTCSSSYFRSWRLARMVETYQRYFFKHFSKEEVCRGVDSMLNSM